MRSAHLHAPPSLESGEAQRRPSKQTGTVSSLMTTQARDMVHGVCSSRNALVLCVLPAGHLSQLGLVQCKVCCILPTGSFPMKQLSSLQLCNIKGLPAGSSTVCCPLTQSLVCSVLERGGTEPAESPAAARGTQAPGLWRGRLCQGQGAPLLQVHQLEAPSAAAGACPG